MDQYADVHYPAAGLDLSGPFGEQRPRKLPGPEGEDVYARTCAVGTNCRGYEASQQRRRGGSRPGLRKAFPQAVGGIDGWLVQCLDVVVIASATAVG